MAENTNKIEQLQYEMNQVKKQLELLSNIADLEKRKPTIPDQLVNYISHFNSKK